VGRPALSATIAPPFFFAFARQIAVAIAGTTPCLVAGVALIPASRPRRSCHPVLPAASHPFFLTVPSGVPSIPLGGRGDCFASFEGVLQPRPQKQKKERFAGRGFQKTEHKPALIGGCRPAAFSLAAAPPAYDEGPPAPDLGGGRLRDG